MLVLLILFGLLIVALGAFLQRSGRKAISRALVFVGGLLVLLAIPAFVVALLNFHP